MSLIKTVLPATVLASGLSAAIAKNAHADVTVNFNRLSIGAFEYVDLTTLYSGFAATGSLTGVRACLTLNDSAGLVDCNEFSVYIDVPPLSVGGLLQIGQYSNLAAAQRYFWQTGGSSLAGTTMDETVTMTSAIYVPADDLTTPGPHIYFGCNNINAGGIWSGSITFFGLDGYDGGDPCVPAPGTIAVLALGGLARRHRRR